MYAGGEILKGLDASEESMMVKRVGGMGFEPTLEGF